MKWEIGLHIWAIQNTLIQIILHILPFKFYKISCLCKTIIIHNLTDSWVYLRLRNPRGSKYKGNQKHLLVSLTRVAKLVRFLCLLCWNKFLKTWFNVTKCKTKWQFYIQSVSIFNLYWNQYREPCFTQVSWREWH